jgi:DNA mismatch repair ATPase MutL
VERFQNEARAAARLRHPNIVQVFEAGEHAGQHYFAMQFIEGQGFDELLAHHPPPLDVSVRILIDISRAVAYLHEQGIVHRDLKPSNIMLEAPLPPPSAGEGRGEGERWELRRETTQPHFQHSPLTPTLSRGGERAQDFATPSTTIPPPPPPTAAAPATLHAAIQLHNSYLVAQSDDGLVIIDQHALHERIMYEELLGRVSRGPLESQRLLIPQTVAVSSVQMALLDHVQPLLARLGVEVAPFGPGSVAVHAFPTFLERLDPADFVRELLERGEQELLDLHQEELLHEILDMMACKAAVKAGDPLSPGEIEALLARRELVERSSNCPHGRPTTLRLTLRDLEKQFKRTGF